MHVVPFADRHDFKKSGIARGGLEYQDVVAVEVLIAFLRNRDLYVYDWVQVEAEDRAYQAIDDIVACRKDGKFELTQVKFTPDPKDTARYLNWTWLTQHRPQGTSLLQKWATTVLAHKRDGTLARAMLKTDRLPDLEFAKCLDGHRVDYRRLTSEMKTIVDRQIGSEERVAAFFETFEFVHSMEQFDDYEESLRASLEHDTHRNGWAHFRQEVRHWAMRKNAPRPDGKNPALRSPANLCAGPSRGAAPRLRRAVWLQGPRGYLPPGIHRRRRYHGRRGGAVGSPRPREEHLPKPLRVGAGKARRCHVHSPPLLSPARRPRRCAVQLLRGRAVPRTAAGGRRPRGRTAE